MKIYIIEIDKRKAKYLFPYFKECKDVEIVNESFESFMNKNKEKIECVVSPANSFGLMDGGYDLILTEWYGKQLQDRVQEYIIKNYLGEQPVGTSFIIKTNKDNQYLIHTPTMRTPEMVTDARIVYQCMRTTLLVALQNNIQSILIPMFACHTGMVKPQIVAKMMYKAYEQINNPPKKIDWDYVETVDMLPEEDFHQNIDFTNF
ncbi:MAG: macro domain-containing protein [Clostridia bacterium]|nr:macro domain-containing protein [Clostridia bacterium]